MAHNEPVQVAYGRPSVAIDMSDNTAEDRGLVTGSRADLGIQILQLYALAPEVVAKAAKCRCGVFFAVFIEELVYSVSGKSLKRSRGKRTVFDALSRQLRADLQSRAHLP